MDEKGRKYFAELDTTKASLLHLVAPSSWGTRSFLAPFVVIAALASWGPLVLASLVLPTLRSDEAAGIGLGAIEDWNVLFMFSVSLPLVALFLLAERSLLPSRLSTLVDSHVVASITHPQLLCSRWAAKYRRTNIWAQVLGVGVGAAVGHQNYVAILAAGDMWQGPGGTLNATGWFYVLVQIPAFYFLVTLYVVRACATALFLRDFVRSSELRIDPFNPDNCGGLAPVGFAGLRNQYLLAVLGVNVLLLLRISFKHGLTPNLTLLCVAAVVAYVVFGPIIFVAPLLPFRHGMRAKKLEQQRLVGDRLRQEYDAILKNVDGKGFPEDAQKSLERLRELKHVVDRIPVWPFDTVTRWKFLTAYTFPFVAWLLGWLGSAVVIATMKDVFR